NRLASARLPPMYGAIGRTGWTVSNFNPSFIIGHLLRSRRDGRGSWKAGAPARRCELQLAVRGVPAPRPPPLRAAQLTLRLPVLVRARVLVQALPLPLAPRSPRAPSRGSPRLFAAR